MVHSRSMFPEVIEQLCADQRCRWLQGERVLVESYLSTHAEPLADRDCLLHCVLHEVGLRREFGPTPDLPEFLGRFPEFESELTALFLLDATIDEPLDAAYRENALSPITNLETIGYQADSSGSDTTDSLQNPPARPWSDPAGSPARQSPAPATPFGDYELLARINQGSMGVVFKARHVRLNRVVAIKTILQGHLASEHKVRRFYLEAEAAARLDHPGIVPVYDVNQHAGQHYIAMGLVEGQTLAQRIARGRISQRDAARLVQQIAEAIQYAHERGVVHRDLKPQNILLAADGRPKVSDFGLAKQLDGDDSLTISGQVLGTPCYMSPEQAAGKSRLVGPLSDVYSLGAVLYCLLSGRPPFQRKTVYDTLHDVLEMPPAPLRDARPETDPALESICLKCLEKEPSRRYGSAGELARELERYLSGAVAQTTGRATRMNRIRRKLLPLMKLLRRVTVQPIA